MTTETRSAGPARSDAQRLAPLGVGVLYNPSLPGFLVEEPEAYDFVSIIPDMFWTEEETPAGRRYDLLENWVAVLDRLARRVPLLMHTLGLSLGTASSFDEAYVEHLATWQQRYRFAWHSDHLSFVRITGADGHDHNAGLAVPVPYDREVLELVASRIRHVREVVRAPFLIENNVYFIDIPEQEMQEPEFLNRLVRETGCGVLLDLHNLYANARNHGFDAFDFLDQLDLQAVGEIHIAGGSELGDMYTDSHSGPAPEPVWQLLEWVLPRAPNVCGITFEFHDSYFPRLGRDGLRAELARARDAWNRLAVHVTGRVPAGAG